MTSIIHYGMVGGGEDAFIGKIHRIAARIDNYYHLVAGVFSSNPERSINFGNRLNLSNDRCYQDLPANLEVYRAHRYKRAQSSCCTNL